MSLEDYLSQSAARQFDRFNLSDVFEYVSPEHYQRTLEFDRPLQSSGGQTRVLEHAGAAPQTASTGVASAAAGRSRAGIASQRPCVFLQRVPPRGSAMSGTASTRRIDVLEVLAFAPHEPDPQVDCDRGVSLPSPADRRVHAPDVSLLAVTDGSLRARCSCWWRATPDNVGFIGHYAAADREAGATILTNACDVLARAGCASAFGPVDGNTWRRYRFIVERGTAPTFFLEPDNPDEWPHHWSSAGFSPATTYTSALNDDLSVEDPRTPAALARLTALGISIRAFDVARADAELRADLRADDQVVPAQLPVRADNARGVSRAEPRPAATCAARPRAGGRTGARVGRIHVRSARSAAAAAQRPPRRR